MIRFSAGAALLVALLGTAARGEGDRRVALVVRGARPDAVTAEVLARIRGELRAARFEVVSTAPGESAPRQTVEAEARQPGVVAAMGIFFDTPDAEVWVADARSARTGVEPLMDPAGGEQRASVLAAKAVDLLRAVLAEVPSNGRPAPPPPSPPVPAAEAAVAGAQPAPLAPAGSRLLLVGAGWLRAGAAQTYAPSLSVAWLGGRLGGRLLVIGLGTSTEVAGDNGTARVGQSLALAELLACARPRGGLRGCLTVGGGAELLTVRGSGDPGYEGLNRTLWTGLADAGASVVWTPRRWIALGADARALGAWPSTTVLIAGAPAGRTGGLGVALTAGVGASL